MNKFLPFSVLLLISALGIAQQSKRESSKIESLKFEMTEQSPKLDLRVISEAFDKEASLKKESIWDEPAEEIFCRGL